MSEAGENIRLQKAVEQYREKETDEAYYAILDAVEDCVRHDAEVWINGNPIPGDPDHVDPSGMEGDDGQFYMMIFSSREASNHGENQHPMLVGIRDMIATVYGTEHCAGLAIDYGFGLEVPMVTREVLEQILPAEAAEF
ncbi:SseB family protein [Anaerolactibacter massiliensis]|uniref:SseB family protein n=1 Tax=Anaerolactibacter massiliensis TaxID=2044573 RepID=UPI000CF856D1|nr:SseB family protein [Anaerolactibacter massiliensis]